VLVHQVWRYHGNHFLADLSPFHWKNKLFCSKLNIFISFPCSFIEFRYCLVNFGKFQRFWKNQEIQDGGSKMAAILEPDVIFTSYDVISLCCGPLRKHFWTYYLPSKFCCHSFNILGVKRWEPNQPSPRFQKTKKSPVWIGLKEDRFASLQNTSRSLLLQFPLPSSWANHSAGPDSDSTHQHVCN